MWVIAAVGKPTGPGKRSVRSLNERADTFTKWFKVFVIGALVLGAYAAIM
jgi:hypothetical protein